MIIFQGLCGWKSSYCYLLLSAHEAGASCLYWIQHPVEYWCLQKLRGVCTNVSRNLYYIILFRFYYYFYFSFIFIFGFINSSRRYTLLPDTADHERYLGTHTMQSTPSLLSLPLLSLPSPSPYLIFTANNYIGMKHIHGDLWGEDPNWSVLDCPLPTNQLVSQVLIYLFFYQLIFVTPLLFCLILISFQDELASWLYKIFLYIVLPPARQAMLKFRVDHPLNLLAFVTVRITFIFSLSPPLPSVSPSPIPPSLSLSPHIYIYVS